MQVQRINTINNNYQSYDANFQGKFIMNKDLYLHNFLAPAEELNVFRNTLKRIGMVDDNVLFSLEAKNNWHNSLSNGVLSKNFIRSYQLFKQNGQDETTKEQIGNIIFTDEDKSNQMETDDFSIVAPDELLVEISTRLKKFYRHEKIFGMLSDNPASKAGLEKEIEELTVPVHNVI